MVEFTKGDMFKVPVDVRVNTVNCVGVMGAGIALAFKNRYPEMFKDYQNACHDGRVRPGTVHVWKSLIGDWVINFPTKRDWKEPSRYEDILSGLDALRQYLGEQGNVSVALPALGCGHGRLDWEKVAPMIKEKLDDLDAHILVFEPADSRNAGRWSHENLTDQELTALEAFGFKSVELLSGRENSGLPPAVLAKGDTSLVKRPWIALLPSKELSDREEGALTAVSRKMAASQESFTIALVYATRTTERVAELFLRNGVAVILILPFGALVRKAIARTPTENRRAPFAVVSLAAPTASWSRQILAQSMNLLKAGAGSVLLSDPAPSWISSKIVHSWAERPMFYLRYDDLPEETVHMLDREGARPIGRRPETGEPNLALLFRASLSRAQGVTEVGA